MKRDRQRKGRTWANISGGTATNDAGGVVVFSDGIRQVHACQPSKDNFTRLYSNHRMIAGGGDAAKV